MAYLVIKIPGCNYTKACSALIASKNYIISAKHCVYTEYEYIKMCPHLSDLPDFIKLGIKDE
jgi:V8-like Glu-specific endopeptidase